MQYAPMPRHVYLKCIAVRHMPRHDGSSLQARRLEPAGSSVQAAAAAVHALELLTGFEVSVRNPGVADTMMVFVDNVVTLKSRHSLTTACVWTLMARDPNCSDCSVSSECCTAFATAITSDVLAFPPRDSCERSVQCQPPALPSGSLAASHCGWLVRVHTKALLPHIGLCIFAYPSVPAAKML